MTRYDHERFADVWNAASSVQEVADIIGISYDACCSRSQHLRREGVYLKRFTKRGGGRTRERRVQDAEFAEVWGASSSVKEVAQRLGMAEQTVHNYAHRLRRNGVSLRRYKHGRR